MICERGSQFRRWIDAHCDAGTICQCQTDSMTDANFQIDIRLEMVV